MITLISIIGMKSAIKISEKNIYKGIAFEYPNLSFDKELSKIAESCAEKCYREKIGTKDIPILENEQFVKIYSAKCYVTKYTASADSDDDFVEKYLANLKTKQYAEDHEKLQKCQFIGVGKYKTQIFIIAFYK